MDEPERKKKTGTLEPFDPSASYVHFNHRIKMPTNTDRRTEKRSRPARKVVTDRNNAYESEVPDSDEEQKEEDSDAYSDESEDQSRRKSSRLTNHRKTIEASEPSFNSRNTRSRAGPRSNVRYTSEESTSEDGPSQATRGTRSRAAARNAQSRMAVYDDDDDDYEEEEEVSYKKGKKKVVPKKPRPTYGLIRGIEDLDDSDTETPFVRAHRNVCEKCHKEPAHILLNKFRKRKGRKKVRKTNEQNITEDEMESIQNLGGWVHWYVPHFFLLCTLIASVCIHQSQMLFSISLALSAWGPKGGNIESCT